MVRFYRLLQYLWYFCKSGADVARERFAFPVEIRVSDNYGDSCQKNLHGHINQTIMYIWNNRRSVAVLVGLKVASPKHTSKLNKKILVCNMATNTDSRPIHQFLDETMAKSQYWNTCLLPKPYVTWPSSLVSGMGARSSPLMSKKRRGLKSLASGP